VFLLSVGTFVGVGSHIKVSYLGSLCELEVVQIVVENGETVGTVHPTDEADISDRMSSVRLSSESDIHQRNSSQRFFQCLSGTSITVYKPPSASSGNVRTTITLDDIGGTGSQKDFLTRLVSSMLDADRANAVKQSGKL